MLTSKRTRGMWLPLILLLPFIDILGDQEVCVPCVDEDGDGYYQNCGVPDCDDTDPNRNPGLREVCDGVDNDCDPGNDENVDYDGDGVTLCGGDCDENDASVNPNATEVCDGIDNDCDTLVDDGFDVDGDGFSTCAGDCDDFNALRHPGRVEICDYQDNDCDDLTDDFVDADGDGYAACDGDCDDSDATVAPGEGEKCDAVDQDCDGRIDEGYDNDGDGVTLCGGDCNDRDDEVYTGRTESCDQKDNDCDGKIDELCNYQPLVTSEYYDIVLSWSSAAPNHGFSFISAQVGQYPAPSAGPRPIGPYYIELLGRLNDAIDVVYFDRPELSRTLYVNEESVFVGDVEDTTTFRSIDIRIPKSPAVVRAVLRSVLDESVSVDIDLSSAVPAARTASVANDPEHQCPEAFAGEGPFFHYYVDECVGFFDENGAPTAAGLKIVQAFNQAKEQYPYLVFYPISSIRIVSGLEALVGCGINGAACYKEGENALYIQRNHAEQNGGPLFMHELGHRLEQLVKLASASSTLPAADFGVEFLQQRMQEWIDLINQNSEAWNCEFRPTDMIVDWLNNIPQGGLCPHTSGCIGFGAIKWDPQYRDHPTLGTDLIHERPQGELGAVSAYGDKNEKERWAELMRAYAYSFFSIDDPKSGQLMGQEDLKEIYERFLPKKGEPCFDELLGEVREDCDTSGLRRDIQLWGEHCFLEDKDHDGVVDHEGMDNCIASCDGETYPEGQLSPCYNPDQLDSDGDGLGDACEECERPWEVCPAAYARWVQGGFGTGPHGAFTCRNNQCLWEGPCNQNGTTYVAAVGVDSPHPSCLACQNDTVNCPYIGNPGLCPAPQNCVADIPTGICFGGPNPNIIWEAYPGVCGGPICSVTKPAQSSVCLGQGLGYEVFRSQ